MVRRTTACLALALTGMTFLAASAGDWPGFRGDGGRSVSDERGLPVTWDAKTGVRWKADLPGRGLSNPVVAGGNVFVTACSGYRETRLHVLCLDAATGARRWERRFAATGNTACHPTSNMAAPTPVTDGEAVYALFATGDLVALSADGGLLWCRSLSGDYPNLTNQVGLAASPGLAGGVLLVPMVNVGDSFVAGLDRRTGKNLWRLARRRDLAWASPVVLGPSNRPAALFQTPAEATAVDAATGKILWSFADARLSSIKSPAAGKDLVFLPANELVALRPGAAGAAPVEVWRAGNLGGGYASPVYHDGRVYFLTPVALVCLEADTGREAWRQRVDGPFDASPVIAEGRLYATNNRGRTTVVELGSRPRVLAKDELGDALSATPAVAGGCLFFRSDKAVYCVGPGG